MSEPEERRQFALIMLGAVLLCAVMAHVYTRAVQHQYALKRPGRYVVDVNRADADELCLLPGIGVTLAQRIVQVRTSEGPFMDGEDLGARVTGVGPAMLESLRGMATFVP